MIFTKSKHKVLVAGFGQIYLISCQILFSYISACMFWAVPFGPGWDHGMVTRYVPRAALLRRAIRRQSQHSQPEILFPGTGQGQENHSFLITLLLLCQLNWFTF